MSLFGIGSNGLSAERGLDAVMEIAEDSIPNFNNI